MKINYTAYCEYCQRPIVVEYGLIPKVPDTCVLVQCVSKDHDLVFCDYFHLYRHLDEKRAEFEEGVRPLHD